MICHGGSKIIRLTIRVERGSEGEKKEEKRENPKQGSGLGSDKNGVGLIDKITISLALITLVDTKMKMAMF